MNRNFINLMLLFQLVGCKSTITSDLNKRIDYANKQSITVSPFQSAHTMGAELKRQKNFRDRYLSKIYELRNNFPTQPIILIEHYAYECLGCEAEYISIYTEGQLINYLLDFTSKKYSEQIQKIKSEDLIYQNGFYEDIIEILDQLNTVNKWNENPKVYGNEDCFDGAQSFYSVYYPDGKVESMYMRCWIPKKFRK